MTNVDFTTGDNPERVTITPCRINWLFDRLGKEIILMYFEKNPGVDSEQVADHFGIDHGDASDAVTDLARRGLLEAT